MVVTRWLKPRSSSRDRHLAATVRVLLLKHPNLGVVEPSVESKAGVVLLRGQVPTLRQKLLATMAAASVRGVAGVFNELEVCNTEES